MCLKDDGLVSSYYVSAPEMLNDYLYKSSRVELKLMTNMDKYLIVENGICEGMTIACHRYIKANNLQYPNYEFSKLNKVSPEEVPDIQSIAPDTEIGYIFEVNLEALVYLHDYFADYPLVPEKQIIPEN
ncbi:28274_t:CDS:2 [Racocetra persica]|uniref:28274_t:CDS:1 n=1 Tax=Racocetra persica TaxID=160502 RepID=A0ACA9RPK6_9GLOM|nr:28274_t:CDS:2 [Racocetra persica]